MTQLKASWAVTKYPHIQVRVYDAKERTRTLVELPE
jgi:hypothetical protein